ncbi:TPA: recombinase family protein, partial [Escherichia coli]|nr:recombinase family protein [Escherichia coli]
MTSNAPTNFVRAYLRASTAEQDASRALETIEAFARERGLIICSYYRGLTLSGTKTHVK